MIRIRFAITELFVLSSSDCVEWGHSNGPGPLKPFFDPKQDK